MGEPETFEDRIVGERPLGGGRFEQTILRLHRPSNKREMLTRIVPADAPGPQETA